MRIDPSAAFPRLPRALAGAAVLAALTAAGCGGSSPGDDATPVERLREPASSWAQLSPDQQRELVRLCRLDVAAEAAGASASGARPPVARSGAFATALQLPVGRLRRQLGRRLEDPAHRRERVADGCRAVVREALDAAGAAVAPAIDFSPPMELTEHGLRLTVAGDAVSVPARTRGGARLRVAPDPGRARTTARITVEQTGELATLRLTGVPRGTSYLRATADGVAQDIVVRGTAPARVPEPRTFVPMRIRGDGSRSLLHLYLPRDGRATVTTEGAPLTLTAGGTVLLAQPSTRRGGATIIPAGRYRDVTVRTSGPWSIRIAPAR